MNLRIKKRWIEALRSGKYSQTKNILRDDKGYCCLGVLCEVVLGEDCWHVTTNLKDKPIYYSIEVLAPNDQDSEGIYEEVYLPEEVGKKAGLSREEQEELAELNDDGKKFTEIADHIEETL